jgi:hypothetical protein
MFGQVEIDVGYRRYAHGFHGRWRCVQCNQLGVSLAAYSNPVAAVSWALAAAGSHCHNSH